MTIFNDYLEAHNAFCPTGNMVVALTTLTGVQVGWDSRGDDVGLADLARKRAFSVSNAES